MPVTDVREIRILPPLAIGRFGSSSEPMHNYEAVITPGTGYRELRPAETLMLNLEHRRDYRKADANWRAI